MNTSKSWIALDGMKALAVIAMIAFHSIFWLLTRGDKFFIIKDLAFLQFSSRLKMTE